MIHKIQTSENTAVHIEVKVKSEQPWVYISKGPTTLLFSQQEIQKLNDIVQTIEIGNYVCKEYGTIKIGTEVYKVTISTFRGITSFQIRQRVKLATYEGFGKKGISLPSYKIKELKMHLPLVIQEVISDIESKNI